MHASGRCRQAVSGGGISNGEAMTYAALKFATAMNNGVLDAPKTIPAWIAHKLGDPQVHLFESQRAIGRLLYDKRLEKQGRARVQKNERKYTRMNKA